MQAAFNVIQSTMCTGVVRVTFLLICAILLAHVYSLPIIGSIGGVGGIGVESHPLEQEFSFACPIGQCYYYCSATGCRTGDGSYFPSYGIQDTWAYGARGMYGCNGGNCGFWGGCHHGYCNGHYNFQDCSSPICHYGPFRGYACNHGYCGIVCLMDVCHASNLYDNPINWQGYGPNNVRISGSSPSAKSNNAEVRLISLPLSLYSFKLPLVFKLTSCMRLPLLTGGSQGQT